MKKSAKIVVITGAESTGKSTLTESLAKYYKVPFIPEIAREYVEKLDRKYNYKDVERIAEKQIELFHKIKLTDSPVIFVDTWLIITKIWLEVVFKKVPEWLDDKIKANHIDLFLVCDTDLPWIPDNVRENGGEQRLKLQQKYIQQIKYFKFPYATINGENTIRLNNAVKRINKLLNIEQLDA